MKQVLDKPSKDETLTFMKKSLAALMDIPPESIDKNDQLVEDLGVDSIVVVQLFILCQDHFDVQIADALDLAEPLSLNQLADLVRSRL
jgi:acyl carrier protein